MRLVASMLVVLAITIVHMSPLRAQVLEWASCYAGSANDWDAATAVAVDDAGHVYVTGGSRGGGTDFDYATIKYDADGDTLWVRRYNGPENGTDVARDVAVDDAGNVFVTGTSVAATIKYSGDGEELWNKRFGQFSGGYQMVLDSASNVFVVGESFASDVMVLKYDTDGELLWGTTYSGPANDLDRGLDLALDSEGNVLIAGESWGLTAPGDGTQWNYTTLKYGPGGALLWARHYNGPAQDVPSDHAFAVAVDDDDNVYVSGWSDGTSEANECLTIKYSPEGETLWERRYPESAAAGAACYDLLVDHGFLYAAARGGGGDTLLKYDLGGNLLWSRMYAHTAIFATNPPRLAADTSGNVYVTSVTDGTLAELVVLKYTPEGEREWEYRYPGVGSNTTNAANDIAVDAAGNVYVAGQNAGAECPGSSYDYLTLKLSQPLTPAEEPDAQPAGYALGQNRPNPFLGSTTIRYRLPDAVHVRLEVYDVLGRLVRTLVDAPQAAGEHEVAFVAAGLPAGVYTYRLRAGAFSETRRVALLR